MHFVRHKINMLSVERKILQTAVGAVSHNEHRLLAAQIYHESVRTIRLASRFAFAAEAADIFRVAIVFVDETFAVAIGDIKISTGRNGDVGWHKFIGHRVACALFRRPFTPKLFASQSCFCKFMTLGVAQVKKFFVAFFAQMQSVCAAFVFLAPRAHKFSIGVKDHHGVVNFRAFADGVLDMDFALRVHGHTVRITIDVAGGQFAPIVKALVLMFARAENRRTRAGLVLRNDVRRGGQKRGGRAGAFKKITAIQF